MAINKDFVVKNGLVLNGSVTANNSTGSSGQVLVSNGTGVYWGSAGGTGATNLSSSANSSTISIFSDTGTDVIIQSASSTNAGLLSPNSQILYGAKNFAGPVLLDNGPGGLEGGELVFAAASNTSLVGSITMDIYQNRLRIFETSGTNRGVYIDLSTASTGVGTNLLGSTGATNLTSSANSSTVTIFSDTGTDAVISGANQTTAGLITSDSQIFAGQKTFANTSIFNDSISVGVNTASGYAANIYSGLRDAVKIKSDTGISLGLFGRTGDNSAQIRFYNNSDTLSAIFGLVGTDLRFYTNGTTEQMRIANTGNIGIGTTVPSAFGGSWKTLHVAGANTTIGSVIRSSTSDNSVALDILTGNGLGIIRTATNSTLIFQTNNTDRLYITNTGNIGIGNSAPSAKLEVTGDIKINSNFVLNSEATTLATVTKTQVASFPSASFRSAKLLAQAFDTNTGEVQISELLVAHNGTTASATEYGVVFTGTLPIVSYDVDILSGNVRLLATRTTTNSTQYKVSETLMVS